MMDRRLLNLMAGDKGDVLLMRPGPDRSGLVGPGENVGHPDNAGAVVGQQFVVVGGSVDLGDLFPDPRASPSTIDPQK